MQNSNSAAAERAALAGVRVLDLADNAVAYASRLLADLGAEVIRIEPPHGNALRHAAPLAMSADGVVSCAHAFWNATRRPSRSTSAAPTAGAYSAIWWPRAMSSSRPSRRARF